VAAAAWQNSSSALTLRTASPAAAAIASDIPARGSGTVPAPSPSRQRRLDHLPLVFEREHRIHGQSDMERMGCLGALTAVVGKKLLV